MEITLPGKSIDDASSASGTALLSIARRTILVVDDEERISKLITVALNHADVNYDVITAADGQEALSRILEAIPDLIILDIMMPGIDGLTLLTRLREDAALRSIPVILLTAKSSTDDLVTGLHLGADDYLAKPFLMPELLARVQAKIERPSIPYDELTRERQTGLLNEQPFMEEVKREVARISRRGATSCLAYLSLDELPALQQRMGTRFGEEFTKQVAALLLHESQPFDIVGRDAAGHFTLLLPETNSDAARRLLSILSQRIIEHPFEFAGERVRLTPTIGFVPFSELIDRNQLRDHALAALYSASLNLDLLPVLYEPAMTTLWKQAVALEERRKHWWMRLWNQVRFPLQLLLVGVITFGVPLFLYTLLAAHGLDITPAMYIIVVITLIANALPIWGESVLGLRHNNPPEEPASPYPPVSAIIAAYLPNEAATIVETIHSFLNIEYPAPVQIILAYNSVPHELPVEKLLQQIAQDDSRFMLLKVENSTSKAQNLNAAIAYVRGEFVGVFDADHHPAKDSFTRAWRWLSHGYDIVQGHCVVRNGPQSWITRMVAIEFEVIYALSHPGRASMHGFAIFGGSNGYWKTSLLHGKRMHGSMLTEDIDSTMRVVPAGYKIASDARLISLELAPVTLHALWNQRMRWAQGWFQVSLKRLGDGLRSPNLKLRQKVGLLHLLAWREVFPWISVQVVPILIYWVWHLGSIQRLNWLIPLFILTAFFTLITGPAQVIMTYFVAVPEIKQNKWWFIIYIIFSLLFYTTFKNFIVTIAQLKQFMYENEWRVTPR